MIFIGIDIAKNSHFASAVNSDNEVIVKPFKFTNDDKGFNLFINTFKNFDLSNCIVGLESTGIYGDNLTTFLFSKGFKIGRINPIQTDSLRSSNIRKTRFKFDVKKSQSKAKVQLVTCLDIAFPELSNFFKGNLHIKSSYALLTKYPTAKIIANTRIDALTNLLYSASKGHFKTDKAIALKDLAKHSIAMDNPAIGKQIQMLIEQIQMLQKQINLLDIDITNIMEKLNSPILSIPGIGVWLGAIIISEIGDITRFSSATKLLAFAGLDPSVRQSGNFNANNTKISKRGSKHLRFAINYAAELIIWNDDTFYQYYTMKLAQGKSYLNAIGHVAHKLTRVIFKLLTTNTTFKA